MLRAMPKPLKTAVKRNSQTAKAKPSKNQESEVNIADVVRKLAGQGRGDKSKLLTPAQRREQARRAARTTSPSKP